MYGLNKMNNPSLQQEEKIVFFQVTVKPCRFIVLA